MSFRTTHDSFADVPQQANQHSAEKDPAVQNHEETKGNEENVEANECDNPVPTIKLNDGLVTSPERAPTDGNDKVNILLLLLFQTAFLIKFPNIFTGRLEWKSTLFGTKRPRFIAQF